MSHGTIKKDNRFGCLFFMPPMTRGKTPDALRRRSAAVCIRAPTRYYCTCGEKEQTSKRQTNDVYGNCLVKKAVCDVALCSVFVKQERL